MRKTFILILSSFIFFCAQAQIDTNKEAVAFSNFSLDKLMNVQVVTASGYLQTTAEAPSTILVITAQQIADRGYEQLEDALRDVPGIDMVHVNGYAPTLYYFRGMYGAQNLRALFMIDGVVENNIIGSNDMAGPAYSLYNVERIEIIWGPASALYGANAFGGIINIITKKGKDIDGFHAEAGKGTFNTSFANATMGERKNNYEYSLAGSLYNTDGPVFTNRDPQYSASFVDHAYSFNGTFSYYSNKSKATLGCREYRTPMGWGTYLNSPNYYLGLPNQGYGNGDTTGILSRNFNGQRPGVNDVYLRTAFLQEEYNATAHLNFLGRIIYRETGTAPDSYAYLTVDTTVKIGSTIIPAGRELIRANIASYSNRVAGEFSGNYSPSDDHKLSFGADFYRDNVEQGDRRSTFDTTVYVFNGRDSVINYNTVFKARLYDIRYNIGGFFQYILNTDLLVNTSFTFGARDDYNSYFFNSFSPRIVVVNQPTDKLTFKLQYGKAFRAPTNLEIHQAPSNFSLKTEKINAYEADGIYMPSKKVRTQLNLFYNYLTDVILVTNLSGRFTANKNPGRYMIKGLEGSADVNFSRDFSGFANITWQHAIGENVVTHTSRSVSGVAAIKGNAGIIFGLHDTPFKINLSGNYVGNRPLPTGDPYGPSVSGYFLTNCAITIHQIHNTGLTAGLEVHNIFNVKWLDPGFLTADGNLYPTVLEQPGRSIILKLNLDL
jgi:outer membrane receptor protein involved in Fe transport